MCMYTCSSCPYGNILNYGCPTIVRSTSITTANDIMTIAADAPAVPVANFVLELDQTFAYTTDATALAEGSTTYNLVSRSGSTITADQLFLALVLRKMGIIPSIYGSPLRFRAQTRNNPTRVVLLDCLPPSQYVTPTATATTSS